jgi:hypothetical protein
MSTEELQCPVGQICPECQAGTYIAYRSLVIDQTRVRYYACSYCGRKPAVNKVTIPLRYAPRRQKRG